MNKTMDVALSASGFNYITKSTYFESKHKSRPIHLTSVQEGRLIRTERKSQHRKSARISTFDNARKMSPLASTAPAPLSAVQAKSQRRRLLLQQWKEEKEKKKIEASTKKKKPFVVRAVHPPLAFEPLPAVSKPPGSTRTTRSQTLRNKNRPAPPTGAATGNVAAGFRAHNVISARSFFTKEGKGIGHTSFAPANAVFHPPQFENLMNYTVPTIPEYNAKANMKKPTVSFDPIVKTSQAAPLQKTRTVKKANDICKTQPKSKSSVQTSLSKVPNQETHPEVTNRRIQSESGGVLAPKENSQNARVTRRNTKLIDKDKQVDVKVSESKFQSKPKERKTKEIMKRSHNTPKKKTAHLVPKSESSNEQRLRSPREQPSSPVKIEMELGRLSPCVTVSRGKMNARKEAIDKIKNEATAMAKTVHSPSISEATAVAKPHAVIGLELKGGLLSDDMGDENSVNHFRHQLNSEIKRLTTISDDWHKYAEDNTLPEDIQEMVLAAVGQTRLLMSKKLQQFSALVELCASGEARPEGVVTTTDLQGFWDMVFMQVENVDMRFKQLSELRERQWVTEDKPKPTKKPKTNRKKTAAPGAPSKIRAMIEAARRAAVNRTTDRGNVLLVSNAADNKSFEAGFFYITSPVRDPSARSLTPRTPRSDKASLLKNVLSSEARKVTSAGKGSASRAMMRATVIAKLMDEPLSDVQSTPRLVISAINPEATPGRSILKTPNNVLQVNTRRKSAKTVLFETPEPAASLDPVADFQEITVTPEKTNADKSPLEKPLENITSEKSPLEKPVSNKPVVSRRQRKSARSPVMDQENMEPLTEETPSRVLTRNTRRSMLLEKQNTVSPAVVIPTRASRRKALARQVHSEA